MFQIPLSLCVSLSLLLFLLLRQANAMFLISPEQKMQADGEDEVTPAGAAGTAGGAAAPDAATAADTAAAAPGAGAGEASAVEIKHHKADAVKKTDYIAEWLSETPVQMLGIGGIDSFHPGE